MRMVVGYSICDRLITLHAGTYHQATCDECRASGTSFIGLVIAVATSGPAQ